MRRGFFYFYRQGTDRISDTTRQKGEERERNVTADYARLNDEREHKQRQFIERQIKLQRCYNEGEIQRRLRKAQMDTWFVPGLARYDVTKYKTVRHSIFLDGIDALCVLIKQMP